MGKREVRTLGTKLEVRTEGAVPILTGKPVVYNQWSSMIHDYFQERMLPGCFDRCLSENPDIVACIDHDTSKLLGRTASGTLKLVTTPQGIEVEVPCPDTSYGRDLVAMVKRNDINGMSFVFDVITDRWYNEGGKRCRDIVEGILHEVTFTGFPAYPSTSCQARSTVAADQDAGLARAKEAFDRRAACMRRLRLVEAELRGVVKYGGTTAELRAKQQIIAKNTDGTTTKGTWDGIAVAGLFDMSQSAYQEVIRQIKAGAKNGKVKEGDGSTWAWSLS